MHGQRPYKPAASVFAVSEPAGFPHPNASRNISHRRLRTIRITRRAYRSCRQDAGRYPTLDATIDPRRTSDVPDIDLPRPTRC